MREAFCLGKVQAIFGARHSNEREPAFFLHLLARSRFLRGQHAFAHRTQKHMLELQALRRMNRHELHLIGRTIHRIGVGEQRHVRQIMFERHFFAARGFELIDALFELSHIIEPLLAFLGAQHAIVAALVKHGRHNIAYRTPLELSAESLDERPEAALPWCV